MLAIESILSHCVFETETETQHFGPSYEEKISVSRAFPVINGGTYYVSVYADKIVVYEHWTDKLGETVRYEIPLSDDFIDPTPEKIVVYRVHSDGSACEYRLTHETTEKEIVAEFGSIDKFIEEQDRLVLADWRNNQNFNLYKHAYAYIKETRTPKYAMVNNHKDRTEIGLFYTLQGVQWAKNWFGGDYEPSVILLGTGMQVPLETLF